MRDDENDWWTDGTSNHSSEFAKRVSLDSTETWMSDDEDTHRLVDDDWTSGAFLYNIQHETLEASLVDDVDHSNTDLPTSVFLDSAMSADKGDDQWMSLLQPSDRIDQLLSGVSEPSLDEQMKERRRKLAASMERSRQSRAWIATHMQRRTSLRRILVNISASSLQVARILQQQERSGQESSRDVEIS